MCGIWAYLSKHGHARAKYAELKSAIDRVKVRGPDTTSVMESEKFLLAFHRLAIMDPSSKGNQPFTRDVGKMKYICMCNGEIYNFQELIAEYGLEVSSQSDCDVILPMFVKFGPMFVKKLKGYFAIIILELNNDSGDITLYAYRDRIGVRPMYIAESDSSMGFTSEIKGFLTEPGKMIFNIIREFPPGHLLTVDVNRWTKSLTKWGDIIARRSPDTEEVALKKVRDLVYEAVRMCIHADRPMAFLLSGGLDSSLVAGIAAKLVGSSQRLKTFCVGMEGGTDLKYARMVADFIGSEHTEIIVTPNDFLSIIEDVVKTVESYDTTTVRASVGQYYVSRYISQNTDDKVVFIGDGSDEICSGYVYNFLAPSPEALSEEAVRRVKHIHMYDGRRADRCISNHGLEARLPLLDSDFADYYLSIDPKLRQPTALRMEKYLLRKAFEEENVLPPEVLWRRKEAFSDGVSSQQKSWYQIIQEHVNALIPDEEFTTEAPKFTYNTPRTKEMYYYRRVFRSHFGDTIDTIIPYYWMPLWQDPSVTDPSARVLSVYHR